MHIEITPAQLKKRTALMLDHKRLAWVQNRVGLAHYHLYILCLLDCATSSPKHKWFLPLITPSFLF